MGPKLPLTLTAVKSSTQSPETLEPLEMLMFVRRQLMVFALALSIAHCDQPTAVKAPAAPQGPQGPQFLRWSGTTPDFTSQTHIRARRSGAMALTPPLSLDQYTVSFWAVRGESRSVRINYSSSIDNESHPFIVLTTTDPLFVPGVGELAMGDSVLITVTVDTSKIGVSLEPSGLQFGEPAEFKLWYGGAGGDLNGDGVVDAADAEIEATLLGLWYREDSADPWSQVEASHSAEDKSFRYGLPHFCEYAVAEMRMEWAVNW